MSSGVPHRPSGVRSRIARLRAASDRAGTVMGVSIQPGAIALTRMPSSAQATASDFVSCTTPPFDAAYAGDSGAPKIACIEAILMIAPLAFASAARHATAMRMVPVRLMSTTRANSDGSYSSCKSEDTGGVDQHGQRVEGRGKRADGRGVGHIQPRHALRGCAVDPDGPIAGLPKRRNQRAADPARGTGDESGGLCS